MSTDSDWWKMRQQGKHEILDKDYKPSYRQIGAALEDKGSWLTRDKGTAYS